MTPVWTAQVPLAQSTPAPSTSVRRRRACKTAETTAPFVVPHLDHQPSPPMPVSRFALCARTTHVLLALIWVAACSSNDAPADEIDNVQAATVSYATTLPSRTTLSGLTSNLTGIATDSVGSVYVTQNGSNQVYRIDSLGEHVLPVMGARAGDQLRQPCCLAVGPDSRLWVRDIGNHRYLAFALSDTGLRVVSIIAGMDSVSLFPSPVTWDAHGHLVDLVTGAAREGGRTLTVRRLLTLDGTLAHVDTVLSSDTTHLDIWYHRGAQGTATYVQPFGAQALIAHGLGGKIAQATSSTYRVTLRDADRVAEVRKASRRIPLTDAEQRRAARTIRSIAERTHTTMEVIGFQVPTHKPALQNLGFDVEGRLWIERATAYGKPHRADVVAADGTLLQSVSWPADVDLSFYHVRGDRAIAQYRDPAGVLRLVTLEWPLLASTPSVAQRVTSKRSASRR